jgi:hypothetical protein
MTTDKTLITLEEGKKLRRHLLTDHKVMDRFIPTIDELNQPHSNSPEAGQDLEKKEDHKSTSPK